MPSKALEANIKSSRVDVIIREEYNILMEVMERYTGITDNLKVFITELCHPYKNWKFIIKEARGYSLDYFHLLKRHKKGPIAASLFIDIFLDTITESQDTTVYQDGADNLLVYIQKIINEANENLTGFLPVIEHGLTEINSLDEDRFFLFVKGFYQINRILSPLVGLTDDDGLLTAANKLLIRYLKRSYDFWAGHKDPLEWFINEAGINPDERKDLEEIFISVSHKELKKLRETLEGSIHELKDDKKGLFKILTNLPGYRQIADHYRNIPRLLFKKGEETGHGQYWKLIFLFHIMNTDGLNIIHEETLREVNRTLTCLLILKSPKTFGP
jgi:pyruvate,orthophosphate dikinase